MLAKNWLPLLLAMGMSAAVLPLHAATEIAGEPGFSGFFTLGVGSASAASNQIAIDPGNEIIASLDEAPGSASTVIPAISLSLTYTFANLDTELFLGDSIEDFVRFDFATIAGLRHRIEGAGIFEIVAVQTPLATDVWADPYLAGVERDKTERSVDGIRLQWGNILQSAFDFRVSRRKARIGDEFSGDALLAADIITAAEQRLLNRNGNIDSARLTYNRQRGRGESLALSAGYLDFDLDGKAMAFDGYSLQLSDLSALNPRLRLATNIVLGRYRHATANPLYGKENDRNLAALTLILFASDPFGIKNWIGSTTLAYAHEDNAINFYDTTAAYASIGLIRRF